MKFEAPEAPPATAAAPTAGGGAATAAAPTAVVEVRKKYDAMEIEVLGIFTLFPIEKTKLYMIIYTYIYVCILLFLYYMRRLIFFCCATGWFFRQLSWTGAGHCFSNVLE